MSGSFIRIIPVPVSAQPSVSSISPASGGTPGGTTVAISGANFVGVTAVMFGAVAAASYTVLSGGLISAVSPPEVVGIVDITVAAAGGTSVISAADKFTFTSVVPTVTLISPNTGPIVGGTSVTITGTHFTGATAVKFGPSTNASSFVVNSDTQITAVAPAEAAGNIDVRVTTAFGTSATSGSDHYTFYGAPTVTSIAPTTGPTTGGTSVTVHGTNFISVSQVKFGGVAASSFTVNSNTTITAISPAEGAATVDVMVVTPAGTSTASSADQFTFGSLASVIMNQNWQTYNRFAAQANGDLANPYVAIPFWCEINPFNVGGLTRGVDYTTSITIYPSLFPVGMVFQWSFPEVAASGHVYEADIVVWGSYFNGDPTTTITPRQVSAITTLTFKTNYTLTGETQFYDLIYDFYLFPTSAVTTTIAHEFSIALHDQSYVPSLVAGLSSSNKFNFTDTQSTNWIIFSLAGGGTGAQIVLERADFTNIPNDYVIDVLGLINAVIAHGWSTGPTASEWFVGTGLGAEAAQGFGSWTLNSFQFNYNGTIYP